MARTSEQRVLGDGFRGPRMSDTQWAQMRMIESGAPCESCGITEGVILRRNLRWCRTCARLDNVVRRQAGG